MSESRQIQSMIDFIEREAQEKVEELDAAAQEEYDVEKMRLVEAEKAKIRANTEKKKKQAEVDRRVARANYSKEQRMRVMEDRAKIMETLHEEAHKRVLAIVANASAYEKLLADLIRQSLLSIRADTVLHVRQADEQKISSLVSQMQKWYQEKTGSSVSISISKDYLGEEAWGGVIAVSTDGRIICNNTLSYRTKNCFEEQLPTIRYYLFNPESTI